MWHNFNIATKELVPVILALGVWGKRWCNQLVLVRCDNRAVVDILRAKSSKDSTIVQARTSFSWTGHCQHLCCSQTTCCRCCSCASWHLHSSARRHCCTAATQTTSSTVQSLQAEENHTLSQAHASTLTAPFMHIYFDPFILLEQSHTVNYCMHVSLHPPIIFTTYVFHVLLTLSIYTSCTPHYFRFLLCSVFYPSVCPSVQLVSLLTSPILSVSPPP